MAECNYIKKVGAKKVYHSQAREIVANVYSFMKREAESGGPINLKKVQERVHEATGVPLRTVKRIMSEKKKVVAESTSFKTPKKKSSREKSKTDLDEFDLGVIRRTINEFHLVKGERPTIRSLLLVLRESINFQGGQWALREILKKLNFKWKKTENNRKVLIEKTDIRKKRVDFLKQIKRYREENRPIYYMDETYIHSTYSTGKAWSDGSNKGVKVPVSKGKRLIIVHAGNEDGFVPNALLTFESGKKTGDYHKDMNFENYEKWIKNKLIPNIRPNSVIVVDNASYHNVEINRAPSSATKKADMIKWLVERGIPLTENLLKPELYDLIKQLKPKFKMYKIDAIMAEHGHSVLRLPPYHPDLNPIELIWSMLKRRVATKNVTFSMDIIKNLVETTASEITKEEWDSCVKHAQKNENIYLEMEPRIDEASDRIVIYLGDDSSESEDDSHDDSDDSDGDLSGVEQLQ